MKHLSHVPRVRGTMFCGIQSDKIISATIKEQNFTLTIVELCIIHHHSIINVVNIRNKIKMTGMDGWIDRQSVHHSGIVLDSFISNELANVQLYSWEYVNEI